MSKKDILVIGAGELGLAVLDGLVNSKHRESSTKVAVLIRPSTLHSHDDAKKSHIAYIRALEAAIEPGDIEKDSIDELAATFSNYGTVISCTGMAGTPGVQVKVTKAVFKAGVKRYIPWQWHIDYDAIGREEGQGMFSEGLDVRELLRNQDQTEWLIISSGTFMSFLFNNWFGVVDVTNSIVRCLGSWDRQLTLTSVSDIGRLAPEILWQRPRLMNQIVYISSDTISYDQLADTLDQTLGREFKRVTLTMDELESEAEKYPENRLNKYRVVFGKGRGVAWDEDKTYNAKSRIETDSVREWISKHLK